MKSCSVTSIIRSIGVCLAALMLLATGTVAAGAAERGPDAFIESFAAKAISVLRDDELATDTREHEMSRLLAEGFDLDKIAKLALGKHWRSANDAERQTFRELIEQYLLATYGRRLAAYSDQTITVMGWDPTGRDALVHSLISSGEAKVRVDWRVRDGEGHDGWKILDVVVEGVSMLLTQRNEFATLIERAGGRVAALNDHLREALSSDQPSTARNELPLGDKKS